MLQIVKKNENITKEESIQDHLFLMDAYLHSHVIRNHSPKTIEKEKSFLKHWFQLHSSGASQLYTWEAMKPLIGRERVRNYALKLKNNCVTNQTIRSHLGTLSRYFSYVLEHQYIKHGNQFVRIDHYYGAIEQPISEYDIPAHSYDGEQRGIPLDPELLYDFYTCLRKNYLLKETSLGSALRARNYTMAVIAGESGLRAEEVLHLEMSDLFFKSNKIQTRFAKGTRGSGKRARTSLFPPLARDTTQYFITKYRPLIIDRESKILFCNSRGEILSYTNIRAALQDMIKVAQKNSMPLLDHLSWHWFRRIFATRFIERFPHQLSILVELLGHTSAGTVHRYVRHSDAWVDEKIKQILEESSIWPSLGG
jgi:site-specific recombinase XerD